MDRTVAERGIGRGRNLAGIRPLLQSTAVSVLGQGAFMACCPLLLASITGRPLVVALATVFTYLPWTFVALPAGAYADRLPRRTVMVLADLFRVLLVAVLGLSVVMGPPPVWTLLTLIFLVTSGQCFFDSAAQATIPAVLGTEKQTLDRANGTFWTIDNVGRTFLGPLAGAACFSVWHAGPFLGVAVCFLVSAAFVGRLPRIAQEARDRSPLVGAIRQGVVFFARHRPVMLITATIGYFNFFYNVAAATLVLYTGERLHLGSTGYGALMAAMAVGAILGGWKLSPLLTRFRPMTVAGGSLLLQGLGWGVLGGAPPVPVAFLVAPVFGVAAVLVTVAGSGVVHRTVPNEFLGRVTSVFRLGVIGAAGIGALVGGLVADAWGLLVPDLVASGCLVVAGVGVAAASRRLIPDL